MTEQEKPLPPFEAYKVVRNATVGNALPVYFYLKGDNQRKRVWQYLREAGFFNVGLSKVSNGYYCAYLYPEKGRL